MQGARDTRRQRTLPVSRTQAALLAAVVALVSLVLPASSGAATSPWGWSTSARHWTATQQVLPSSLVSRGPTVAITRNQFLAALMRVQSLRGSSPQEFMRSGRTAPALPDARAGSAAARAVAYGWIPARDGKFDGSAPISVDDATLAVTGALGLRPAVSQLAARMRTELPGANVRWTYASAHALARTLGLRYNVLDPNDRYELQPRDSMNVAHGAYMLRAAAQAANGWKLGDAQRLATTFDLPDLGPNQRIVLGTAASLLGQPYVWAGETEGAQPEGKGGFDCSGFAIRVVNESGVPADQLDRVAERTSYTQSAIPATKRITRANLQPGDLMFFGSNGPASSAAQNYHVGIYMGNDWFIHSSGGNGGVAINSLDGWWSGQFSWGRRALRTP